MNKSAIKSRIKVLLVTSSVLTVFGLIENYTDWLYKPIRCYEIDAKNNTLRENIKSKDFCIEHVYLPYQKKQGSVELGIRTKLKNKSYLYTTTTFWIANELGEEKFSDVEGDFTTDIMSKYNSHGLKTYSKLDIGLPNETAPYATKEYKAFCDKRPIFLNDLFMDPECISNQILVWQKIQEISPSTFSSYSIPFSRFLFRWISSNPFKVLGGIFFVIFVAKFYPLLITKRNSSEDIENSKTIIKERLKQLNKNMVKWTWVIGLSGGLGFMLNNTIYLIPADLLCLNNQYEGESETSSFEEVKMQNVCINEVLTPFNSFRGQIELGMIITYTNGSTIVTETTMFTSEDDNFQDAPGDMMHTKISHFNQYGILEKRDSEVIGEQLANLMPGNKNIEIWKLVKNKLTSKNEIMYVSVQRILGEVIEDSLPFMFAAYALLYSYSLYLTLSFRENSQKKVDD